MVLYKLNVFCSDMKFKMAATAGLSLTLDPMGNSHKNLLLRNHGPIATKLWWNDPWMGPLPKLCPVIPTSNNRSKSAKVQISIKNPVIYVKKLIIMLIQFKFGHILA
jgi:hypothetical protein